MALREARPADASAIRRVAEAAWRTDYPEILTRERNGSVVDDWYAPDQVLREIDHPTSLLLVAEADGSVVGFGHATWRSSEAVGYLLRLYVHPDHRRAGYGTRLVTEIAGTVAAKDCDRLDAMVLAENDLGTAFYEQLGFERADESETYIDGESHLEYRYVLGREDFPD